jgi:poly-gamma-glutamate capsule biosynthesis protein CapA/YwtB (metallophosphatase superfamily)
VKIPILTALVAFFVLISFSFRLLGLLDVHISDPVLAEVSEEVPPAQPITLRKIFDGRVEYENAIQTRILVTGDVLPARMVNTITTQRQNFRWPFEKTADRLRAADITFINLETPLVNGCRATQTGMIFCGDPRNIEGLQFAGVDVASVANNHALNQGREGFLETVEHLEAAGIQAVGESRQPVVIEKNGVRFAFLGYNDFGGAPDLMAEASEQRLRQDIERAREVADVVLAQFHWGDEYRRQPNSRQRELAHLAVDLGVDVVLGNHPHWFQSVEIYNGKPIAYSHGNFIFDQMWSTETRQGVVGEYIFVGSTLVDVVYHPVLIEEYSQPRWLEGGEAEEVVEEMREASEELRDLEAAY